jgi:tetratricopeptide (TPR) repeat protein
MEHKVMATTTVPAASSTAPRNLRADRPPLWQAPLFVVGVAALLAVWLGRPAWFDTPTRRVERELAQVRSLLDRPESDPEQAVQRARQAVAESDAVPARGGEACYWLGAALIRLAERGSAEKSAAAWREARENLEQAEQQGVPEAMQPLLNYRRAKVGFYAGEEITRVVERLEATVPHSDARAEGYALLTQAYLRLPNPDLKKALEANNKLRGVPEVSETDLARAKLVGGELLFRLGRPEEARRNLAMISAQAPPEIVNRARLLQARSYQQDRKWDKAISLYQEALADNRVAPAELAAVHFHLGGCFREADRLAEAAHWWQECLKRGETPEAILASLYLLALPDAGPERLDTVVRLFARYRTPEDWNHPLLDLAGVRTAFERASQALRQHKQPELALRLLDEYARLAVPGRPLVLKSEIQAEWARQYQERTARAETPEQAKQFEDEAGKLYRQAAEASAEAARIAGLEPKEQVALLWTSVNYYQACADWPLAARSLELVLGQDPEEPRKGEGWFRLGEVRRRQNDNTGAAVAYRKCLEFPTRFAALARYQLAMASLQSGDLEDAEDALKVNIDTLRYAPDPEALEKSLFQLGSLLYQRRKYRLAVHRLEEAINRFRDDPEVPRARFQLADSYRQISLLEYQSLFLNETMSLEKRAHFEQEYRTWLRKAAEEFDQLDKFLDTPAGQNALTPEQRVKVPFITARCWLNAKTPAKALEIYQRLAKRHEGRVEQLDALGGIVSCYALAGDEDKVRQHLVQIQMLLRGMDEAVRVPWQQWVEDATGALNNRNQNEPTGVRR